MTPEERTALTNIIEYPPEGHERRSDDGYPTEVVYDSLAYRRMVTRYRNAIRSVLDTPEDAG